MHSLRKPGKRRRTGCTRCRASHHKCDERQPRCGRCQRLNQECEPVNFIVASDWCQLATDPSGLKDDRPGPASTWDVFNNSLAPLPQVSSRKTPQPDSQTPLSLDAEKVTLIQAYQNGVGAWMDLFDDEANFQRTVVKRALRCSLLMSAICALTARHITMVDEGGEVWKPVAVQYYGESLRQLIASLDCPTSCPVDILAATILLSSYELLASPGLDHRRHVSGALTLIRTHACRASSEGLMAAAFWVYARQDIAMALVHECPTMLPPDEWGVSWDEQETREGQLGNQMVWLLARVIAHTFRSTTGSVQALSEGRASLIKELDAWHERLPESFRGTAFGPPLEEGFLPRWFAVPSTAAAMCMHHLAHLLLLAEGCNLSIAVQENPQSDINEHARSIASIAFSPISDGALVQTVQSLYFAAKHIECIAQKVKIWALLDRIESKLGFHTSDRVKQLTQQIKIR